MKDKTHVPCACGDPDCTNLMPPEAVEVRAKLESLINASNAILGEPAVRNRLIALTQATANFTGSPTNMVLAVLTAEGDKLSEAAQLVLACAVNNIRNVPAISVSVVELGEGEQPTEPRTH